MLEILSYRKTLLVRSTHGIEVFHTMQSWNEIFHTTIQNWIEMFHTTIQVGLGCFILSIQSWIEMFHTIYPKMD